MVKVDESAVKPDMLAQLVPSDYLTRLGNQHEQNLKRLSRQPNAITTPQQLFCTGIHLKRAECVSG